MGSYFSIEGKNIIKVCRKLSYYPIICYVVLLFINLFLKDAILSRITIIVGLVAIFNTISYFIGKGKLTENKKLSNASFFIYAFHGIAIFICSNRMQAILPHTDWAYVLIFFSSVIIVALLGLGLYVFMKRFFPRFTSVITGGR